METILDKSKTFQRLVSCLLIVFIMGITHDATAQFATINKDKPNIKIQLEKKTSRTKKFRIDKKRFKKNNADWMQLKLSEWNLARGASLTIRSVEDGTEQTFTQKTLDIWGGNSAYFNGSELEVELSTTGNAASSIIVGDVSYGALKTRQMRAGKLCGSDNRVGGDDVSVGRVIVPTDSLDACTAFLTTSGFLISAGHCHPDNHSENNFTIVEFRTGDSTSEGKIIFSDPIDQYPIGTTRVKLTYVDPYEGTSFLNYSLLGRDSWLFETGTNSNGDRLTDRQGDGYRLGARSGTSRPFEARVDGYGLDDGVANFTYQTHTEYIVDYNSDGGDAYYEYDIDTMGGGSGGPIIDTADDFAIGIHTVGECSGSEGNYGTAIESPPLSDDMRYFWTTSHPYVDAGYGEGYGTGYSTNPYRSITAAVAAKSNGDTIYIHGGTYTTALTVNKDITFESNTGIVDLGDVDVTSGNTLTFNSGTYRIGANKSLDSVSGGEIKILSGVTILMKSGAELNSAGKLVINNATVKGDGVANWGGILLTGSGADNSSITNAFIGGGESNIWIYGADNVDMIGWVNLFTGTGHGLSVEDALGIQADNIWAYDNDSSGVYVENAVLKMLGGIINQNGQNGIYVFTDATVRVGDLDVDADIVITGNDHYGLLADYAFIDIGRLYLGELYGGNGSVYDNGIKEGYIHNSAVLLARNTYWNTIKEPTPTEIYVSGNSTADWTNWLEDAPSKGGPVAQSIIGESMTSPELVQTIRDRFEKDQPGSMILADEYIALEYGQRKASAVSRVKAQLLARTADRYSAKRLLTSALNSGIVSGYQLDRSDRIGWARLAFSLAVNRFDDPMLANKALSVLMEENDPRATRGGYDRILRVKANDVNYRASFGESQERATGDVGVTVFAYPNPFNPSTTVTIDLVAPTKLRLEIFNVLGQRISQIADGSFDAGRHSFRFEPTNLTSGIYFYRVSTESGSVLSGSMMLMK